MYAKSLLLLFVLGAYAGCAAIVDAPVQPTGPVTDVRSIYLPLTTVGDTLRYSLRDSDCNHQLCFVDTFAIVTQGRIAGNLAPGIIPAGFDGFHTTFPHEGYGMDLPGDTLFATTQNEAYNISYEEDHSHHSILTHRWLDLKQPIKDSASWQFTTADDGSGGNSGPIVLATVTLFDFTANLDGVTYTHVSEVTYRDSRRSSHDRPLQIKWYAKDLGLLRMINYLDGNRITDQRLIKHG